MSNHEHKTLTEKEKELRKLEHDSIKLKAKFIMEHSSALIKLIETNDEAFMRSFIAFLMSNSNDDFVMNYEANEYSYEESLSIIFKVCFSLPSLGFDADTSKNIRDKVRLYTKYFKTNREIEAKANSQFVIFQENTHPDIKRISLEKKTI